VGTGFSYSQRKSFQNTFDALMKMYATLQVSLMVVYNREEGIEFKYPRRETALKIPFDGCGQPGGRY